MGRAIRVAGPAGLSATGSPVPLAFRPARLWPRCSIILPALPPPTGAIGVPYQSVIARVRAPAGYGRSFSTVHDAKVSEKSSYLAALLEASSPGAQRLGKPKAHIARDGFVTLVFEGSGTEPLTLSTLWLRDSCPCPKCVDPHSGQKTFSTTDLPDEPDVSIAELRADGSLKVVWAHDAPSGGDSHTSIYPAEEVAEWRTDLTWQRDQLSAPRRWMIPWDRPMFEALLAEGRCRVRYEDWMADGDAFWKAFVDLRQTGLIFISGVPGNEDEVERLAGRIGPLQHTFYGMTWDVKSKPQAENVAYTSEYLGLHQDLLYHDPVPALQLLHCLSNSCEGGESLFSHGPRAFYEIELTRPDLAGSLRNLKTSFKYRKGQHHHFSSTPTVLVGTADNHMETRWAPPFQATFRLGLSGTASLALQTWRRAAAAFQATIESPNNMVEVKLKPGECVIFDNRRVLHGRRKFTTGEGSRWLKGAYVSEATYNAATSRLADYVKATGQDPRPQEQYPSEGRIVRASLLRRRHLVSAQLPSLGPEPIPEATPGLERAQTPASVPIPEWARIPEAPAATPLQSMDKKTPEST